jgi:uncharacterized protein (UPF0332 family)
MIPSDFIALAKRLATAADSGPPEHRSATSRAYYGAFLSARALLETELSISCKSGGSEHQYVQRLLLNSQVAPGIELGTMLQTLQFQRKVSDYDMDVLSCENSEAAGMNVDRAERILTKISECSQGIVKAQLKAGITQYRRLIREIK